MPTKLSVKEAQDCDVKESLNSLGPHRCESNDQCKGARTCTPDNWCIGENMCNLKNRPSIYGGENNGAPKNNIYSFEDNHHFGGMEPGF